MKILIYSAVFPPAWQYGGPVSAIGLMTKAFAELGHEVEVFTTNAYLEKNVKADKASSNSGLKITYFRREKGIGIKSTSLEKAVTIRAKDFDLIYVVGVWQRTSLAAWKAAAKTGVPFIVVPHGDLSSCFNWDKKIVKKRVYYSMFVQKWIKKAAFVQFTSQQEQDEARFLKITNGKIITNPFDPGKWKTNQDKSVLWHKKMQNTKNDFVILSLGRLHHKKNIKFSIEILSELKNYNWTFNIVGEDNDGTEKRLKKMCRKYQIENRVQFWGGFNPKDLPNIYAGADLFVLPSLNESFGYVVLESIACGTPVLISDQVALRTKIAGTVFGNVLPLDKVLWTDKLKKIFSDVKKSENLQSAGRKFILKNFDKGQIAKSIIKEIKNGQKT